MFIDAVTNRGEFLFLNIAHILLVASDRKGTVIVDVNGIDYHLNESYDEFVARLRSISAS